MLRINPCTVLSASLLCLSFGTMSSFASAQASASADLNATDEGNTVVRWQQIVGLITAQGVSKPVGKIGSGTTPWHARNGAAAVDLTNGEAAFFVQGLAFDGGNTSGSNTGVNTVEGALVCDAGAADQTVSYTSIVPLDAEGNAEFKGRLDKLPSASCSNPIFLVLNAAKGLWIATGAVRTTRDLR